MREIVLDTETTGLDPAAGHRVVEIACLELVNHVPSGHNFQRYINPEREMPSEAFAVHGLSTDFLAQHPVFSSVADEFLSFIGDAPLVIHNAEFDLRFLNSELERVGRPPLTGDRAIDTVRLARRRFPGSPASLDALCRRFSIDNSARTKHGALLDAELLAEVYLELLGGREPGLVLGIDAKAEGVTGPTIYTGRSPRPHAPSGDELAAHAAFVATLKNAVWSA
jgi:DNA polymerase-3 subunit epsilon